MKPLGGIHFSLRDGPHESGFFAVAENAYAQDGGAA